MNGTGFINLSNFTLHVLDFTQKNIIATSADDLRGIKDYEKIHPLIHNIINTGNNEIQIDK